MIARFLIFFLLSGKILKQGNHLIWANIGMFPPKIRIAIGLKMRPKTLY